MQLLGQTLLSRYKIEQVLGSGGFGDTYLAVDTALPKSPQCVVKHLKPKHESEEIKAIALSLFEREAHTLYELGEHESIPRLFAHFEQQGEFFLVQEFIDGQDLSSELIPGKPWSSQRVGQLLQELLEILSILHSKQVIHRDVKPQNIMRRTKDGKLFLIDFGAVKEIPQLTLTETGQTALTVAIGSPGYMPSEQAVGKPRPSSDLYAVGMIAIQALTGQYPQALPTDAQTGDLVWHPSHTISSNLESFVRKLTQDHFSQRYQDAIEASQTLQTLIEVSNSSTTLQSPITPKDIGSPSNSAVPPTEYQPPFEAHLSQKKKTSSTLLPWIISGASLITLGVGTFMVIAPWEGSVTISQNRGSNASPESNVNININRGGDNQPSAQSPNIQPLIPQTEIKNPSHLTQQENPKNFSELETTVETSKIATKTTDSGVAFVIDPPSNIRATPNGRILCAVPKPQIISISTQSEDWYQTSFCNEPGFIHSSQLSFENLKALVIDPPSNIRDKPNGNILCAVTQQDVIETFGESSGWYFTNVCNTNAIGYIHHSQIRLDP